MRVEEARDRVLAAALRRLSGDYDEPHGHSADEADYANEQLALAARDLAEATEALPARERPVGWTRTESRS